MSLFTAGLYGRSVTKRDPKTLPDLLHPLSYLSEHMARELDWTLRAANEWIVPGPTQARDRRLPRHCLRDGLNVPSRPNPVRVLHTQDLEEPLRGGSARHLDPGFAAYDGWESPLHGYLMHAQRRDEPKPLVGLDGAEKDLNRMAPDVAQEIERLWTAMADALRTSGNVAGAEVASELLVAARSQAGRVFTSRMATRR